MNQEIKQKWVEALRSGEYQQGIGQLNKNGMFCCLGVLCDLHAKETNGKWEDSYSMMQHDGTSEYFEHALKLPQEVKRWAEISIFGGPLVKYSGHIRSLPHWNDQERLSFNQIADLIEAQL